ncbi:hypothetical protein K503DRAFT_134303 [Rhizopogon vinicolor AM-OR11-026]|uniref:Membrane-associated proteins in eicosanoid and glutathione metabolism n=1 Tax=Rhizopogon vinicolor AM-OR11-026 TaxID=1314800 RepID=A0A1B7N1Q1_9AGAM|nr:hypothetical protein K503DRAFT_134303 [Rhizopogon vinicolor AM-OR11-026]
MALDFLLSDSRLALLSIPAVWVLNLAPALLRNATIRMSMGWDNVNPRSNIDRVTDKELAARAKRMDGAHQNALESFPLWSAAVLAATIAKVDTRTVNSAAIAFFCLRALYTMIYIIQKTNAQGSLRTAVWFAACIVTLRLLFQAAKAAAQY